MEEGACEVELGELDMEEFGRGEGKEFLDAIDATPACRCDFLCSIFIKLWILDFPTLRSRSDRSVSSTSLVMGFLGMWDLGTDAYVVMI